MNRKYIGLTISMCVALFADAQLANKQVEKDFQYRINSNSYLKKQKLLIGNDEENAALKVLYAYMPLCDIADHTPQFYKENVGVTLKARREMPWGAIVPDREFRHFVLPLRVNDEVIDNHRPEFYNELKDRVKGLSMEDAILEVNHWCHEKATYQPSDMRTHSPLQTVYSGIGRCGEESTFAVAALRAVGIPARQVYTPRWAHTDDNHAWVEAWANGKWYFLGACEPEPILNLGWFNAPASRGMLMNTRTYGRYDGPEEKLLSTPSYTDINVTSTYGPIDELKVKVVDESGNSVVGASVSFRLYNYAEFYPLATKKTDSEGFASLQTGLGDLLVWVSDGNRYTYKKCSVGRDKVVSMVLGDGIPTTVDLTINPPVQGENIATPTEAQIADNKRRIAYEDSIRTAYYSTFVSADNAKYLASELNISLDDMKYILSHTRGNHKVIIDFLRKLPWNDRQRGVKLLGSLSEKDLCDIPAEVLDDCMSMPIVDSPFYVQYILSPRVAQEPLTPYKGYFRSVIPSKKQKEYCKTPEKWIKWVADNIDASERWYPPRARMSPRGVMEVRKTAPESRDIFFVASARAMGIPARIDPVTEKVQWADSKGDWIDVDFNSSTVSKQSAQGCLKMRYEKVGRIDNPKYYTNFTISKIVDGEPQLMNYPEGDGWEELFRFPAKIDAGEYMLVTGQRLASGGVLSKITRFAVQEGDTLEIPLIIRQDNSAVQVIGGFDAETIYHDANDGKEKSILSTTGRGYYILGILKPNDEPTNHALRDIATVAQEMERWGRKIVLLYDSKESLAKGDTEILSKLPNTVVLGVDSDGNSAKSVVESLKLRESERPIFLIADTFNRIVFVSQGYTIGLGETLVDIIHKLK